MQAITDGTWTLVLTPAGQSDILIHKDAVNSYTAHAIMACICRVFVDEGKLSIWNEDEGKTEAIVEDVPVVEGELDIQILNRKTIRVNSKTFGQAMAADMYLSEGKHANYDIRLVGDDRLVAYFGDYQIPMG